MIGPTFVGGHLHTVDHQRLNVLRLLTSMDPLGLGIRQIQAKFGEAAEQENAGSQDDEQG